MILDEYGKMMNEALHAIGCRYIPGVCGWVEGQDELRQRDKDLETNLVQLWTDKAPIEQFREVLIEYYHFWLKAIRDYKDRNQ